MRGVRKNQRTVNGVRVPTQQTYICGFNDLDVEVGTTGYKGGDTGHGGRTYFRLKNSANTDMTVRCNHTYGEEEVILEFGGDAELKTFIGALEYTLFVLREQIRKP